ncbi:MAG: HAMP domain-containing methyl-accepting chemotaxis protein [Pseudobdellovibrionaceae bacterium]
MKKYFSKLSLKSKLISLCSFFIVFLIFSGAVSYFGSQNIVDQYEHILAFNVQKVQLSQRMFLSYRYIRIELLTMILPGISKEQGDKAAEHILATLKEYEDLEKEYASIKPSGEEPEYNKKVDAAWAEFKPLAEKSVELWKSHRPEDLLQIREINDQQISKVSQSYREATDSRVTYTNQRLNNRSTKTKAEAHSNNILMFSIISGTTFIGLLFGLLFSNSITRALSSALKKMAESSTTVSTASTQIASASHQLAQASTEQAASLQETASSVEELSSMVSKNTENSKRTADSSSQSQSKANEGQTGVEQMISSMEEIHSSNQAIMNQIGESNTELSEIIRVIKEIGDKTKVINDIVFQTKLLSFNASVEAARAGEQGKGFAVVAEEVGNLAQMSGSAAKEITDMLDQSIQKVESIVNNSKDRVEFLMAQGKEKIDKGVNVANQCASVLNDIVENVANVSTMASEISTASDEQARGISEINKAMAQLDTVTQQNAAASNQTSQAAERLSVNAGLLNDTVKELEGLVYGSSSPSKPYNSSQDSRLPKHDVVVANFTKKYQDKFVTHQFDVPHRNASGFGDD